MKKLQFLLIFLLLVSPAYGQIDLNIIARIESNYNPLAYNKYSQARGMYQITPIALLDYNQQTRSKIPLNSLYNSQIAFKIANWYLNQRIPQLLQSGDFPIKIEYILICYNFGYGNFKKWYRKGADFNDLPNETKQYILKYRKNMNQIKERRKYDY